MVCEMLVWIAIFSLAQAEPCADYARPRMLLRVQAEGLMESSGLAASRKQDGLFYTHNDSGSEAALYGFSTHGGAVSLWPLLGIDAVDFEDMAAGPCPGGGDCLYIGDIGDNSRRRSRVQIYAFRETANGVEPRAHAQWDLAYPTSPQDAETLLVHPKTGRIYVVTKTSQGAQVFRVPIAEGTGELEWVANLDKAHLGLKLPKLTGGDFSREGDRVVLRGYLSAWEWVVDPTAPEAQWLSPPDRKLRLRLERQGEAIAYDLTGRVFTSSEGSPMPLTRIGCAD
jgi:hypothetical protein